MFKVMVQGKNREELVSNLLEFVSMLGIQSETTVVVPPSPPATEPAQEKRGRGRPKKEETAPVEQAVSDQQPAPQPAFDDPFAAPSNPAPVAGKTYTAEQVLAALKEFAQARTGDAADAGAKRVYGLIQQFGYKNVKEIKPEHYAAIVAGTGLA